MSKKQQLKIENPKTLVIESDENGFILKFDGDKELVIPVREPKKDMFLSAMTSPSFEEIKEEYKEYQRDNETLTEAYIDVKEEYEAAKDNYETALEASLTGKGTAEYAEGLQRVMEQKKTKLDTLEAINKRKGKQFQSKYSVQDIEDSLSVSRNAHSASYLSNDSYCGDVFEELSKQIVSRLKDFTWILDRDTDELSFAVQEMYGDDAARGKFKTTTSVYGVSESDQ
ncbi:hypothetical protein CN505_12845 [Bacillus cereus]|nr:hypothetical protein CN505_12845 [Bacillus cereus]